MTAFLTLIAILVPASVTLTGYLFTHQSGKRLDQEREQENGRLKLDAAMRAADLFGESVCGANNAAKVASGLLALARLDFADLAVAQLADFWHPQANPPPGAAESHGSCGVSTETAIQVINAALETGKPEPQLMAAELLYRNACELDITDSLHWPSSVNSTWIPELPVTAKLLIVDALVHMALASKQTENALRELAVRLYGVAMADPEPRVQGCIGALMKAILPAVGNLGYTDFMKGPGHGLVTLGQMEHVAAMASPHPDGYFEAITRDRCERLAKWALGCAGGMSLSAGNLAPASCALR
jgi:hypothetical protein